MKIRIKYDDIELSVDEEMVDDKRKATIRYGDESDNVLKVIKAMTDQVLRIKELETNK
jgi:hypothetical protein